MPGTPEERLAELGLAIPASSPPKANYTNCVQVGTLLFVAGKGPSDLSLKGKLGREFSTTEGAAIARGVGLEVLGAVREYLGTLDRVRRVVRVQAFINATEEYDEHHIALDGFSDLMVDVFGDAGIHTRSVFGAMSLRGSLPLITECIFEVAES
ncbi:MAG: RidA family protein [Micropruina sp.]|uniref:RidA family protein n=1 Tax=Micropruina sp. TaxID=2737536 RepID=UPI0039E27B55